MKDKYRRMSEMGALPLTLVFLSNRIYPEVTNRKLNQLHIRERIQGAIYDAMKKK